MSNSSERRRRKWNFEDLLAAASVAAVGAGLYQIYPPLTWIWIGLVGLVGSAGLAWLEQRTKRRRD